ncbi:MAG: phage antirepressor protein [Bacilli bacterium]|nr:phage antirepressor protein [Bacilli bacterium]
MNQNKLKTISNLFEGNEIRSIWDSEKEDYYFSVVDVIGALTGSNIPKRYWSDLKRKLEEEGSELYEKIVRLKIKAKDGKLRETDSLNTEGIFRLIESVPSPKAEPFKLWLAKLGRQEVDNVFDPSKGIDKMIDYYLAKGYTLKWIEARIKAIIDRKKLTNTWKENGITNNMDYAILTNEIYKSWSGMTAGQYKSYKNIRKENLRDNMTDIEVVLTDLGEIATKELAKEHKPYGLEQNKMIAKMGGSAAKAARDNIEKNLGKSVITKDNQLNYKYIDDKEKLENK